ncbi:MAG: hypothetical protein V4724_12205 [Pseudomonadota bacterium]
MRLPEKYRFEQFKSRTDYTFRRRGSNMEQVDTALKAYWLAVGRNHRAGQITGLLEIVKQGHIWLALKKDKNDASVTGMFKTRWDEITQLSQSAIESAAALANAVRTMERNKARHAPPPGGAGGGPGRPALRPLDAAYKVERDMYKATRQNPISMTTVHENVHGMLNEDSMSYDAAAAAKYGSLEVLSKPSRDLTPADMIKIEEIMKKVEKDNAKTRGFQAFQRHVVFLDRCTRLPYIAIVVSGRLMRSDGVTAWSGAELPYAMDGYGNLFIEGAGIVGNKQTQRFNHSSLLAGKEVTCAGILNIEGGLLLKINTNSGHYKPTGADLYQAVLELEAQGVDLSRTVPTINVADMCSYTTTITELKNLRGMFTPAHRDFYNPRAPRPATPVTGAPGAATGGAATGTPTPR